MPPATEHKTERPTRRKRERVRQEGMTAQSVEVNNALVLLAAAVGLFLAGQQVLMGMAGGCYLFVERLPVVRLDFESVKTLTAESMMLVSRSALPLMLLLCAVGTFASVVQTGVYATTRRIRPDWGRVDPVRGLKGIFSISGLVRLIVALLKIVIIGAIVWFFMKARVGWLKGLANCTPWGLLAAGGALSLGLLFRVAVAMVAVALLDYGYQRWRFEKQIMMSKSELKEELKRDEGDPEVRARQARMRRTLAQHRMIQAVPKATVVVTNPTHLAVALRWDEAEMDAPVVVAKGKGPLAERIKRVAEQHGVPVVERRALAQALYAAVEVGMEIPPKLYAAVAEVLAFVLRPRAAMGRRA